MVKVTMGKRPSETQQVPAARFARLAQSACVVLMIACAGSAELSAQTSASPPSKADQASSDTAQPHIEVPEASELAMQYYRSGNWLWVMGVAWGLLVPLVFAFSGASARVRDVAQRLGKSWFLTIVVYGVLYELIMFVINLPWQFYRGFIRPHAYELSNQTAAKWFSDSLLSLLVAVIGTTLLLWIPYLLLKRYPQRWWLAAGVLAVPLLLLGMLVHPTFIAPLFNDFGRMQDRQLEDRILSLADRAGIEGGRVFEVDKSIDTRTINAYVTGVGSTKRIVLWDTILTRLDEDELLFVMGHEMGHYVLGHVHQTILLIAVCLLAGLFAVHVCGNWIVGHFASRLHFSKLDDIASVPILVALLMVGSYVARPAVLAFSRYNEHEADRFGLEITQNNRAAASAFAKLQSSNLGNPRPGALFVLFRGTHPPLGARIEFCNRYRPWETGGPLVYESRFTDAD